MDTEMNLSPSARRFWDSYAAAQVALGQSAPRLYDIMKIGRDAATADAGARLILSGRKTATSASLSEFDGAGQRPPSPEDLSLVLDGLDEPVCIVKTVAVTTQPFRDVDETFACEYGEWDGTLATWRERMLAHYAHQLPANPLTMPLVCERFVRVWPETAPV